MIHLKVGHVVRFVRDVNLEPHATIKAGERGTVTYIDADTGYTDIRMDTVHKHLREYDNCVWLIPPDTDDVSNALVLVVSSSTKAG